MVANGARSRRHPVQETHETLQRWLGPSVRRTVLKSWDPCRPTHFRTHTCLGHILHLFDVQQSAAAGRTLIKNLMRLGGIITAYLNSGSGGEVWIGQSCCIARLLYKPAAQVSQFCSELPFAISCPPPRTHCVKPDPLRYKIANIRLKS